MRALVLAHQARRPPRRWRASPRTSLSRRRLSTGRTCRQPTEACAYQVPRVPCFSKIAVRRCGVVGEMLERHRAILDEGDRLSLLLHRHHDVEAGGAHVGDRGLQRGIEHVDHAAPVRRRSCPRRSRDRPSARAGASAAHVLVPRRPRRTRPAASRRARRARTPRASGGTWRCRARARSWCGRPARPRSGPSLTMCCAASIASIEAAEVADADRAAAEQRRRASARSRVENASVPSEPTRICARLRSLRPGTSASRL